METVKSLRQAGNKVRVIHDRPRYQNPKSMRLTSFGPYKEKGGTTEIQITTPEGIDVSGKSKCSPKDNYNKKLGVRIALGRALEELKYSQKLKEYGKEF